jgi:hypothetical protein
LVAALCFVFSGLYFFKSSSNRGLKEELNKLQAANQDKQQAVRDQDEEAQRQQKVFNVSLGIAQLRQNEIQQKQQLIEFCNNVQQRVSPAILVAGYRTAKNNNENLRKLLTKLNLEDIAIPKTPEQMKAIEEQLNKLELGQPPAANPGTAPAPVTNRPAPPVRP